MARSVYKLDNFTQQKVTPILSKPIVPAGHLISLVAAMIELSLNQLNMQLSAATKFLLDGGPSIWAIAALSVLGLTVALWKLWRFMFLGAWGGRGVAPALRALEAGQTQKALQTAAHRRGVRSRFLTAAITARENLPLNDAREETTRIAKGHLNTASAGLRVLELISTIAPLLGLFGTVLGMIAAFQALQESGSRADPAILAGGIWEALLTTAAGMAVAIPASIALTWFESIVDRIHQDFEDIAARVFVAPSKTKASDTVSLAAE